MIGDCEILNSMGKAGREIFFLKTQAVGGAWWDYKAKKKQTQKGKVLHSSA